MFKNLLALIFLSWTANVYLLIISQLNPIVCAFGVILYFSYVYYGIKASKDRDFGEFYGWTKNMPKIKGLISDYITYDKTPRFGSISRCSFVTMLFALPAIRKIISLITDNIKLEYILLVLSLIIIASVSHYLIFDNIATAEAKAYEDYENKVYAKE